jgi:hypothetical protein
MAALPPPNLHVNPSSASQRHAAISEASPPTALVELEKEEEDEEETEGARARALAAAADLAEALAADAAVREAELQATVASKKAEALRAAAVIARRRADDSAIAAAFAAEQRRTEAAAVREESERKAQEDAEASIAAAQAEAERTAAEDIAKARARAEEAAAAWIADSKAKMEADAKSWVQREAEKAEAAAVARRTELLDQIRRKSEGAPTSSSSSISSRSSSKTCTAREDGEEGMHEDKSKVNQEQERVNDQAAWDAAVNFANDDELRVQQQVAAVEKRLSVSGLPSYDPLLRNSGRISGANGTPSRVMAISPTSKDKSERHKRRMSRSGGLNNSSSSSNRSSRNSSSSSNRAPGGGGDGPGEEAVWSADVASMVSAHASERSLLAASLEQEAARQAQALASRLSDRSQGSSRQKAKDSSSSSSSSCHPGHIGSSSRGSSRQGSALRRVRFGGNSPNHALSSGHIVDGQHRAVRLENAPSPDHRSARAQGAAVASELEKDDAESDLEEEEAMEANVQEQEEDKGDDVEDGIEDEDENAGSGDEPPSKLEIGGERALAKVESVDDDDVSIPSPPRMPTKAPQSRPPPSSLSNNDSSSSSKSSSGAETHEQPHAQLSPDQKRRQSSVAKVTLVAQHFQNGPLGAPKRLVPPWLASALNGEYGDDDGKGAGAAARDGQEAEELISLRDFQTRVDADLGVYLVLAEALQLALAANALADGHRVMWQRFLTWFWSLAGLIDPRALPLNAQAARHEPTKATKEEGTLAESKERGARSDDDEQSSDGDGRKWSRGAFRPASTALASTQETSSSSTSCSVEQSGNASRPGLQQGQPPSHAVYSASEGSESYRRAAATAANATAADAVARGIGNGGLESTLGALQADADLWRGRARAVLERDDVIDNYSNNDSAPVAPLAGDVAASPSQGRQSQLVLPPISDRSSDPVGGGGAIDDEARQRAVGEDARLKARLVELEERLKRMEGSGSSSGKRSHSGSNGQAVAHPLPPLQPQAMPGQPNLSQPYGGGQGAYDQHQQQQQQQQPPQPYYPNDYQQQLQQHQQQLLYQQQRLQQAQQPHLPGLQNVALASTYAVSPNAVSPAMHSNLSPPSAAAYGGGGVGPNDYSYLSPPPGGGLNGNAAAAAAAGGGIAAVRYQQQQQLSISQQQQLLQQQQQQQPPYGQQQFHHQSPHLQQAPYGAQPGPPPYWQQQQQQEQQQQPPPYGQMSPYGYPPQPQPQPYNGQHRSPYPYGSGGGGSSAEEEDEEEEDVTLDILEPVEERRPVRKKLKKKKVKKGKKVGGAYAGSPPVVRGKAAGGAGGPRSHPPRNQAGGLESELDAWLAHAKPSAGNMQRAKFGYVKKNARQLPNSRLPLAPRGFHAPMK